jgi:lysyl-tRNA synthetase class 1
VGEHLVKEIFGGEMPLHFGYSFVGTSGGSSKMSSSTGSAPTPSDALEIFEAPLVRWLYARRRPEQSFTVAFGDEVGRVYEEWDALTRRVNDGTAEPAQTANYVRASSTADGKLPVTAKPMPFRTLASIFDITAGDEEQELRILRDLTPEAPIETLDEVRPRLDCAQAWATKYAPDEARTRVREEPDTALLNSLTEPDRRALRLLTDQMTDNWSLAGVTTLVYGIPKLIRGLPLDAPPTPELKVAQREWFKMVYRLLIGKDTGPRLPTLLLALGQDRARRLLNT